MGNFFSEDSYGRQRIVIYIKNIIRFFLRNNKYMANYQRHDIQEGNKPVIFGYYVTRNFAANNF